ncbi:MAG TPA: DNA-protecting protein DprA [Aquifex aeolicus]|nr:DNA-protecting protein DprA [Aquifex aeolicus]
METLLKYIRLADTNSIGPTTVKKIINHFGSIEDLDFEELKKLIGKTKADLVKISINSPRNYEKKLVKVIEDERVVFVTLEEKDYPDILKTIPDPPPFLFYIGEKIKCGIGVVGTRKPSEKSLKTVEVVVKKEKGTVISGGAKGIDYKAHLFALEQGIPTVIVLGSGILEMDRRIKVLLEKYENISVVSEFLPWKKANKYTFPKRNRIIAGLSEKIFVIEAGRKSGALITASYAKRYGRKVFVYIGDEDSERWEGCKELLKKGIAKKIEFSSDLNKDLISFLSKPRTFDEVMSFLNSNLKDTFSVLTRLMLEGKIIQEGAYYTRI